MKDPSKKASIQFRWSVSAAQPVSPCPPISTARNTPSSRLTMSTKTSTPSSPRLPMLNKLPKKTEPLISTNTNRQICPLLLTYSQLYRAQHPSPKKKPSQPQISIYTLLNKKSNPIHNPLSTSESTDPQHSLNEQYIRLRSAQLRRLHVSEKNFKEAKKLYFNANCKVFVPLSSIIEAS